jgi:hypothetical protein
MGATSMWSFGVKRGLYEYLIVVECKDYATPVPVEKVEAFVTKAAGATQIKP